MEKSYYLVDFVSFIEIKSGVFKISCSVSQEACIYRWLVAQGFGRTLVDGKIITFHKTGDQIKPAQTWQMRDAFYGFLKAIPSNHLPDGLTGEDLLEWYYHTPPIKQNNLYRQYLKSSLTEMEIHSYKMNADCTYYHRYQIGKVLNMLSAGSFKQTIDQVGTISKGHVLYFRQIANSLFLIFCHQNAGNKNNRDEFDCWLASFRDENQIGRIKAESLKDICLSFQMDKDYPLIEAYLKI